MLPCPSKVRLLYWPSYYIVFLSKYVSSVDFGLCLAITSFADSSTWLELLKILFLLNPFKLLDAASLSKWCTGVIYCYLFFLMSFQSFFLKMRLSSNALIGICPLCCSYKQIARADSDPDIFILPFCCFTNYKKLFNDLIPFLSPKF